MHASTQKIKSILGQLVTIESQRPDEALKLCEIAIGLIESDTDPQTAIDCRYKQLSYLALLGSDNEGLVIADVLIEACEVIEDWITLSRTLNIKGNLLGNMGLIDKSLEAYMASLRLSERFGNHYMIGVVANNVGGLYQDLNDINRAKSYYQTALKNLEESPNQENGHFLKGTVILNLAEVQLAEKNFQEALTFTAEALEIFETGNLSLSIAHCYGTSSEIYQGLKDPVAAKRYYQMAKAIYQEVGDTRNLTLLTTTYAKYLIESLFEYEEAIQILKEAEFLGLQGDYRKSLLIAYDLLAQCYEKEGDLPKSVHYYKAYFQANNALEKSNQQQQLNVMRVRFEIEQSLEEKASVQKKNDELREKSIELMRKKEELELAYHRIQIISQIGQKITSTLDLSEITLSVYDNLKKHMPIDSFYMAMLNDDKTQLISVTSVEYFNFERHFEVPIDHPNSIMALSYRQKKSIFIEDTHHNDLVKDWKFLKSSNEDIRAIICVPLLYDDEVIGVCSVQSTQASAYDQDHMAIMDALSTYLAIAINNAQKSKSLEQEIQMRQLTQKELERLNIELRNISEIDGLTKVPNRRRFENVYEQMFEVAVSQQQELHVVMMDIDFFKVYNDHYGHLKGDEVLIAVAQKLNLAFRYQNRLFARYGGEEFVAVLGDMSFEEAKILAQELRVAVANMGIYHEHSSTGYLTISIGVASMVPKQHDDMRRLLHHADECLYLSKNKGRNRVEAMVVDSL